MATKNVKVKASSGKTTANLQIIAGMEGGIPVIEPHKDSKDRVKIANKVSLVVLDEKFGTGFYYIADIEKNGAYQRYFIKSTDIEEA